LDGEIYWYRHVPETIIDLFPKFISFNQDNKSYEMEKIDGSPLSYLYLNESCTNEMFANFLDVLERIHHSLDKEISDTRDKRDTSSPVTSDNGTTELNIYDNYESKIMERYKSYDYSRFPNSGKMYQILLNYFKEYEEKKMGMISVIHGDPVFSNILVTKHNDFKFIDMRGKIGNKLTILGDKWYDYGKIYQSLIGYDEILLGKVINHTYKKKMMTQFESYVNAKFGTETMNKIRMITNSLLFTLIPLHDNDKCLEYYNLINMDQN